MLREDRKVFGWMILAGLGLHLLFFVYFPAVTDDSRVYLDLATNWLQHGIYGQTDLDEIVPSDTRLPGYPAFLATILVLFGAGNIRAVLIVQILFDLATCLLIADLARRTVSSRLSTRVAFGLAAMCPFLANYAAAVLTETLEIFFTALALDCAVAAMDGIEERMALEQGQRWTFTLWAATGAAIAACILLRPDGGILLVALGLYLGLVTWKQRRGGRRAASIVMAGVAVGVLALAPLVPWTIRNLRTMHHFQPLAPRYASEAGEQVPRGFNRWVATWMADYASVEEIYWSVPGEKISAEKLPSRALDEPAREATLAVIANYNESQQLTPEIDARFGELAEERRRAHPVRSYVALPALRVADMWLRPRTEILPPDVRWWEFNDDGGESALAVGFGLLNLVYVGAAVLGMVRRWVDIRYIGLLGGFVLLRTIFLGTIENPEPRYTLECFPVVIVLAGALWRTK